MSAIPPASTAAATRVAGRQGGPGLLPFLRHLISIMTPADRLLFFVLLGIGLLSILGVQRLLAPGHSASVFVADRLVMTLPLATRQNVRITGTAGAMELRITGEGIQVIHSTCPGKICIKQGIITRQGQVIVCVPNHMLITIDGETKPSLDAVTP